MLLVLFIRWAYAILVGEVCPLVSLGVTIAAHVRGERIVADRFDVLVVIRISIYLACDYRC